MKLDAVLREDLERIAARMPDKEALRGCSVLITGATGLVGGMLVRSLAYLNEREDLGIRILAWVRSREKAEAMFPDADVTYVVGDITQPPEIGGPVDYIFHTASVTASKTFVTKPVETLLTALDGTRNVLELARARRVKGMVYLSSMEAYGITDPALPRIREADLGYIDVLSVRSSYSEGKRACECLCAAYAGEYGVPVKIARLAQTFGAGVSREDNRAFAQFTGNCLAGKDIVLHTRGTSVGNYCYTTDAVVGLMTVLLRGSIGEAYTVANEETARTIREVAELVSDTLTGGRVKILLDIPENALTYGYAPDVTMRLSAEKLRALGWVPEVPLAEMFRRLARSYQSNG